jgi:CubicO group peptidase (beta-lactamase class C family)
MKKVEDIFRLWEEHPGAGGQLVVTRDGETLLERCWGYQDIESQTPMTQESVFHLASMSKQVTAMCIYMLYEQGKLDLEDDIKKYLPDLVRVPQKITINHLLHHTSGLPDHYSFLHLTGRSVLDTVRHSEILRLNARIRELNFEPGDEFMYSNPNYVFLAEIVERLSGMSLNRFCKENIFGPLGMERTFIRDDPSMLIPNRVHSYDDNGYRYTNAILNLTMYGSTCLHSTCRDMNRYLQQYKEPTLISKETMEKHMLVIPPLNDGSYSNYAGGVRIDSVCGHRYIHHGGVNAGFRTFGVYFPEDGLTITVFTNTYNIPIETAGIDVARVILGLPERERPTLDAFRTEDSGLADAPGFYYCDETGDNFTLKVVGTELYRGGVPLKHLGGNLYKQGRLNMTFALGETICANINDELHTYRKVTLELPEERAEEYVGEYFCDVFESFWSVLWENGKLYMYHLRHGKAELHWLGDDAFSNGPITYTFLRDAEGKVTGVNRAVSQLRKMVFEKRS